MTRRSYIFYFKLNIISGSTAVTCIFRVMISTSREASASSSAASSLLFRRRESAFCRPDNNVTFPRNCLLSAWKRSRRLQGTLERRFRTRHIISFQRPIKDPCGTPPFVCRTRRECGNANAPTLAYSKIWHYYEVQSHFRSLSAVFLYEEDDAWLDIETLQRILVYSGPLFSS